MAFEKIGNIRGPQGEKGNDGAAAGFGTPVVTVDDTTGTPSAEVLSSGPDTAKVFTFQFHGLKGADGADGAAGQQGPQGVQGEQGPQGIQGVKGDPGEPFKIAKTYESVSAMNAGYASDGVKVGQFVVIDTGNVEDPDNAKLYMKGESAYTFLTDMSGAAGLQGPKGEQGPQGVQGAQGPQGVKGDTGDQGPQGAKGETGTRGSLWTSGAGAPSSTGNVGDMYLDTTTGDVYRMA